jgi:hypothetical protein
MSTIDDFVKELSQENAELGGSLEKSMVTKRGRESGLEQELPKKKRKKRVSYLNHNF